MSLIGTYLFWSLFVYVRRTPSFPQSVEPVRESPVHPRRGFPLGKAFGLPLHVL
jgi:hypothetical protein